MKDENLYFIEKYSSSSEFAGLRMASEVKKS